MSYLRIERPRNAKSKPGCARIGGSERLIYVASDGRETDITDAGWTDLRIAMKPGETETVTVDLVLFEVVESVEEAR